MRLVEPPPAPGCRGRSRVAFGRVLRRRDLNRHVEPPGYERPPRPSKLDPFRGEICAQLDDDPQIPSQRLRELCEELGYAGSKTIFDDYVRDIRPRYLPLRTYQRTVYRPGELCQFDLWGAGRSRA